MQHFPRLSNEFHATQTPNIRLIIMLFNFDERKGTLGGHIGLFFKVRHFYVLANMSQRIELN